MWSVTVIFPYGIRFTITPQRLIVAGLLLAVAVLLGFYVMLLRDSVERGQRLRAEQHTRVTAPSNGKTAHYVSFSRATTAVGRP